MSREEQDVDRGQSAVRLVESPSRFWRKMSSRCSCSGIGLLPDSWADNSLASGMVDDGGVGGRTVPSCGAKLILLSLGLEGSNGLYCRDFGIVDCWPEVGGFFLQKQR